MRTAPFQTAQGAGYGWEPWENSICQVNLVLHQLEDELDGLVAQIRLPRQLLGPLFEAERVSQPPLSQVPLALVEDQQDVFRASRISPETVRGN